MFVVLAQLAVLRAPLPDPRRVVGAVPVPPPLRLQLQALAEHPISVGTRGAVAIGLAALAALIATALHFDGRAVPVAIGALALIGFVLADFYRLLRDAHAPTSRRCRCRPTTCCCVTCWPCCLPGRYRS